ncbi:conserved hypothetical protein [Ricinus communis]|uniref:Uncharacterized protein n=1 Tax=Ricinus communis TaxID=3988 RepID=B9RHK0_RICCO|nr:conserved hypothetical protein [Ricinus communis]
MILDGCFMLEILPAMTHTIDDHAPNDPIFSNHTMYYLMPFIRIDMLMLEIQIPSLVLHKMLAVESEDKEGHSLGTQEDNT